MIKCFTKTKRIVMVFLAAVMMFSAIPAAMPAGMAGVVCAKAGTKNHPICIYDSRTSNYHTKTYMIPDTTEYILLATKNHGSINKAKCCGYDKSIVKISSCKVSGDKVWRIKAMKAGKTTVKWKYKNLKWSYSFIITNSEKLYSAIFSDDRNEKRHFDRYLVKKDGDVDFDVLPGKYILKSGDGKGTVKIDHSETDRNEVYYFGYTDTLDFLENGDELKNGKVIEVKDGDYVTVSGIDENGHFTMDAYVTIRRVK